MGHEMDALKEVASTGTAVLQLLQRDDVTREGMQFALISLSNVTARAWYELMDLPRDEFVRAPDGITAVAELVAMATKRQP